MRRVPCVYFYAFRGEKQPESHEIFDLDQSWIMRMLTREFMCILSGSPQADESPMNRWQARATVNAAPL
jgi:hypothetical protein